VKCLIKQKQMNKNLSIIKQRVFEFLDKQNIKKSIFFSTTGIVRSNFGGANAKSELGGDNIVKILTAYPYLNPIWLLTGKGDMLCFNAHMERENWITSDEKFHSVNHSHEELLRVGTRIDEVCWQYGTSYKALSRSVGISLSKLEKIIAGEQPAPKELLEKIAKQFPGLDLGWLFCGWGRMFTDDWLSEQWFRRQEPGDELLSEEWFRKMRQEPGEVWLRQQLLQQLEGLEVKRKANRGKEEQNPSPINEVASPATKEKNSVNP
jgi:hypothetical protein